MSRPLAQISSDFTMVLDKVAKLKVSRTHYSVAQYENKIYFVGGINPETKKVLRQNEQFKITNEIKKQKLVYKELPSLNKPRYKHSSLLLGKKLYIFAGMNKNHEPTFKIEVIDIKKLEPFKELSVIRELPSEKNNMYYLRH